MMEEMPRNHMSAEATSNMDERTPPHAKRNAPQMVMQMTSTILNIRL